MDAATGRLIEPGHDKPRQTVRVPAEFVGLARALRAQMAAEHARWEPCAAELIELTQVRTGFRRPKARHVAELWSALPGAGARLGHISKSKPARLRIAELRLFPARLRMDHWPPDADELSLSLACITLGMEGSRIITDHTLLADVGLHALARRYERGRGRHDEAVLGDVALLAGAYERVVAQGGAFAVGGWRGDVALISGVPVLSVRTFVAYTK